MYSMFITGVLEFQPVRKLQGIANCSSVQFLSCEQVFNNVSLNDENYS